MSKLKPYPRYKDSGIEWIGEIPEEWVLLKYKNIFRIQNGYGFPNNLQGDKHGKVPFLKVSDISFEGKQVSKSSNYVTNKTMCEQGWKHVESGSILTAKIGEALRMNHRKINSVPCIIDNNMMALTPKPGFLVDYLFYNLNVVDFDWYSNPGAVPSLNNRHLREDYLMSPTIEQQRNIVEFLDVKTYQIDSLISDKEKLIKLLEEKRQAVINETVTKSLDPNVRMRESGIKWIGEIPEHWEVRALKRIAKVEISNVDKKTKNDELEVLLCNYVDVYYNNEITDQLDFMKATAKKDEIEKFQLKKDDVIITKDSESSDDIAVPAWVSEDMRNVLCGYHLALIRPSNDFSGKYLLYLLLSTTFREQFHSLAYGVTRYGILKGDIENSLFLNPPLNEQNKISKYLTELDNEISVTKKTVKIQISKLKEYRESLIYEAVTGKIDLRDYEVKHTGI